MTHAISFTELATSERPLQPDECASLAKRAAGLLDPAAVSQARTGGGSVVLWEDEHSVSWLNVMPERRDTGYHDHDGSSVGVFVIEGSVTNEGLPIGGPRRIHRYGPGDLFSFPGSGIHRMDHDAGAITVHVYSPPLTPMLVWHDRYPVGRGWRSGWVLIYDTDGSGNPDDYIVGLGLRDVDAAVAQAREYLRAVDYPADGRPSS